MRTFNTIDAYIEDEMRQIEESFKMPVSDIDRKLGLNKKLSKRMPKKYPELSVEENMKRLKLLATKIQNGTDSASEWEEYGWRMLQQ
jgi:hypothetical protein